MKSTRRLFGSVRCLERGVTLIIFSFVLSETFCVLISVFCQEKHAVSVLV